MKNVKPGSNVDPLNGIADFFGDDVRKLITNLEISRRAQHIYMITCKDHASAKNLASKYNKKELFGNKVSITLLNFH